MVKKRIFDFIVAIIASIFSIAILSCAGTAGGGGMDSDETALSVRLPANRSQWAVTDVQSFTVTISSSSYKDTKSAAGGETITFSAIPVGHYTVEALGKNSNGDLTAKGGAEIDVVADTVTEAVVALNRLNYYTVRFLDSDGTTEISSVKVTEGYAVAKPTDPSPAGKVFSYWKTSDNSMYNFSSLVNSDINLTAVYDEIRYTIRYESTPTATVQTGYDGYYTGSGITLPTPLTPTVSDGWTFEGWYTDPERTVSAGNAIPSGETGDKTFYAKWTAVSYTITYHNQPTGISGWVGTESYTVEAAKTLNIPSAGESSFTFIGWYENSEFSGAAITEIPVDSTGAKDFYAKWTTSVVLNGNGGQIGLDNTHTENGVIYGKSLSDIITGYTPSRTGYEFLGWNTSSTATSASDLSTATVTTGTPTYYAIWAYTFTAYIYSVTVSETPMTSNPSTAYYRFTYGIEGNATPCTLKKAEGSMCYYLKTTGSWSTNAGEIKLYGSDKKFAFQIDGTWYLCSSLDSETGTNQSFSGKDRGSPGATDDDVRTDFN